MTTALTTFQFQEQQLRIIIEGENIYFLAADACAVLGYKQVSPAIAKHCKSEGVINRNTPTKSGEQDMVYISEPNLYRLMIRSKMPFAEKFEKYIMEEVLPSIRKTGKYGVIELTVEQQLANAFILSQKVISDMGAKLAIAEPKADAFDATMDISHLTSLDTIAHNFKMSRSEFIDKLIEYEIFGKLREPKIEFIRKGWFVTRPVAIKNNTEVVDQTFLTESGRAAITLLVTSSDNTPLFAKPHSHEQQKRLW